MTSLTALSPFAAERDALDFGTGLVLNVPSVHQLNRAVDLRRLRDTLHCSAAFSGCGLLFDDGQRVYVIARSTRATMTSRPEPTHVIISPATHGTHTNATPASVQQARRTLSRGEIATEIGATVLSCGGALLSALVVVGGAGLVPVSGGTSTALVVLGGAAAAASGLQCVNGVVRLTLVGSGETETLEWLDSQQWYVATGTLLDTVALAGAGGALAATLRTWRTMRATSHRSALDWLRQMPRHERKRLTEEIIRAQNPGISARQVKQMIAAGIYPLRYPSDAIQHALRMQLTAALSAAATVSGSALAGNLRHPGQYATTARYLVSVVQSLPLAAR